ncbi:hypothetical protein N7510_004317 [Penicillium lagena]|uniref:uncharacterized protein n=1 Tax=Penicillium lagena TaxID=94218 RepID=UPI0025425EBA|nr:uncharacterized protein N7510_004317 [Penicillium lagena]KAJ5620333.1 hypothetical protein N7510_004317 [Penicillium lagena]
MADPLSIASGVDQDAELFKITQNFEDLQAIFRSLQTAVHDRRSRADAQELFQVDKATRRCEEVIEELKLECQKFRTVSVTSFKGRITVAGRRAAYPFRKSTLQKLEEDISEIRKNLSLALGVLQIKVHHKVHHDIVELKSLLERINMSHISSTTRAWLAAPDASIDHNATCAKRHTNTGLWLVNGHHFANWLTERNSFLWINGFAGSGKSVLCSTAIQYTFYKMKHTQGLGIAFFYFAFNDDSKQSDHGMLRALLLQLSTQLREGEKDLEQLQRIYKSGTPPVGVLLDTLRSILSRFHETFILLDGLDECPRDRGREDVLRGIETIRKWSLPGLHILVTSRNDLDIYESLNPAYDQTISMRNTEIDNDITNFVSAQLKHDPKLQRWKSLHTEIQKKLTQRPQGVFRYVECQLKALRRARNRNQLDACLLSLPRDLDETYERILCNIDETYIDDARRILTVLCFSTRPLTINELIDAHAVDLGASPHLDREGRSYQPDDLIDICLGLVEIADMEDENGQNVSTARIAHFSVKEYLQSARILQQKAKGFAIQSGPANTEIAQISVVYLLEPNLSNGVLDAAKVKEFPLAHFAAENWYHHYENSEEGKSKVEELLPRLFQHDMNCFMTWIKLYDMDRQQSRRDYQRLINDVGPPLYYASLLGLESIAASFRGHVKVAQMLLDRGANVNAQCGRLGNALQAASAQGHEIVVQMLLSRGADVNAQDGLFSNALKAASFHGHERVVQLLLERGANINAQCGIYGNVLQAAYHGGNVRVVQILLDRGADINAQCEEFGYAVQAASIGGHEKVVQLLLDRGADIHAQGGKYGYALQAASIGGHEKVVQLLIDRGANIHAQGGRWGSSLHAASLRGYEKVVQLLLDHGADPDSMDQNNRTPLFLASARGHDAVVALLSSRTRDPNLKDQFGRTPLHLAAAGGHLQSVRILLTIRGIDPDTEDNFGLTAQADAARRGQYRVVQLLQTHEMSLTYHNNTTHQRPCEEVYCDICLVKIPDIDIHYHCNLCDHGNFDVCNACISSGAACLESNHELIKRLLFRPLS